MLTSQLSTPPPHSLPKPDRKKTQQPVQVMGEALFISSHETEVILLCYGYSSFPSFLWLGYFQVRLHPSDRASTSATEGRKWVRKIQRMHRLPQRPWLSDPTDTSVYSESAVLFTLTAPSVTLGQSTSHFCIRSSDIKHTAYLQKLQSWPSFQ
jgi:hypothetical protein